MPTRKVWKNERTFRVDIDTGNGIINIGTVNAKSVSEARRKGRQMTRKKGYTWGKKWKQGWLRDGIEGTQGWLGNNDYEPTVLLWVYLPKAEVLNATTRNVYLPKNTDFGDQHANQ